MKTEPSPEKLFGIAQAARLLGMHYVTVGKLVRQGIIRGSKTENGDWVVTETEVTRYLTVLRVPKERH